MTILGSLATLQGLMISDQPCFGVQYGHTSLSYTCPHLQSCAPVTLTPDNRDGHGITGAV